MAATGTVDPLQYCAAVAQAMGVQVTPYTVAALKSLADGEGQWTAGGSWNYTADFNPFNISGGQSALTQYAKEPNGGVRATQPPGNGPPVDEFTDWQTGIQATADFIKNADPGMYSALQAIAANPTSQNVQQFFTAAGNSGSFGSSSAGRISFFNGNLQAAQGQGSSLQNLDLASYSPPTPGAQTPVPGIGNPANATTSPSAITPGAQTTSSIQYPQGENAAAIPNVPGANDTWAQTEAYIKKNYPTYGWLLNIKGPDSPATVIEQAVLGGWDATRLQAAIAQTDWWKTTSTALQQWEQNTATKPGQYDFNTPGSAAQQMLGTISSAAKSANWKAPDAVLKNLATEAMMYGWDTNQITINVGDAAASGAGTQFGTGYLTGMQQNSGQYAIAGFTPGAKKTGPVAATALQQVKDAIASQAYNVADFTPKQINTLAHQVSEFALSPGQLAAAVIKAGSGGSAGALSQQWTQGMISDKANWLFAGQQGATATGANANQALTAVKQAIAGAQKTLGSGPGQITEAQAQQLAQESMMFNWSPQQLSTNINNLDKAGGGLLDPGYLQGLLTDSSAYQPGGEKYNEAKNAVTTAAAGYGKKPSAITIDALTEDYLQRGWQSDPNALELAIGSGPGGAEYTSEYLTGAQANPGQYQPGGATYVAAAGQLSQALLAAGVKQENLSQDQYNTLIQGVIQQGWQGQTLINKIGALAQSGTVYNPGYLTGYAARPSEYAFTSPKQNKGLPTTADQVLTQVEIVAGNQSVNLTVAQAKEVAIKAMQSGGNTPSDALIQSLFAPYVNVRPTQATTTTPVTGGGGQTGLGQGGVTVTQPTTGAAAGPGLGAQTNAPALLQQLRTQATNYLISPPDNVLQQWAQQIAGGTQTMQSFEAYLAQQAGEKYPGMQAQIQQGQTPTQVAGGLTTLASQILEIQPDQVNYLSPQFQKMLTGGFNEQGTGPNATKIPNNAMMTQTQAGDYLRSLPQWQYTQNAKALGSDYVSAIVGAFGRGP